MTFSDVMNFDYNETTVDKDIRHLLTTGQFKPAYEDMVRTFLAPEIANCQDTLNDENHHLTVIPKGSMSEDLLKYNPEVITPVLDRLKFTPKRREFWYNYFTNPTHGRQKSPPLSSLRNGTHKEMMLPFGLVTDPFNTIYTEIHELMHACQAKYYPTPDKDKTDLERYTLLYQGKSLDEANEVLKTKYPDMDQNKHAYRCFIEMQANSAGACYMMLQAVRTGNQDLIAQVEKRLKNEAASMSGALMNEHLGLAYFEYPATQKIIEEVKAGKCADLLNEKGLLNWKKLYDYTKAKVDEMGYTPQDMSESRETAKLLQAVKKRHPDDKTGFLAEVEALAPTLKYPHNKICTQFVEAQRIYQPDNSKNLHNFYHRLGAVTLREQTLANATPERVPYIEEYRKIYQTGQYAMTQKQIDR